MPASSFDSDLALEPLVVDPLIGRVLVDQHEAVICLRDHVVSANCRESASKAAIRGSPPGRRRDVPAPDRRKLRSTRSAAVWPVADAPRR